VTVDRADGGDLVSLGAESSSGISEPDEVAVYG
jgi:hypothetical protein